MGDETRVQIREVKKGVEAMGGVVERYMIRMLGPLGKKIQGATKAGRIMALAGVVVAVVGMALIAADALSFRTEMAKGELVVSRPVVNIREKASVKGKVAAKAEKGETLTYLATYEDWYKVRSKNATGWVARDMVEQGGNKSVVIVYEMKGYGIVLLAGLGLLILGIVQKKK